MRASTLVLLPGFAALLCAPGPAYSLDAHRPQAESVSPAALKGSRVPTRTKRPRKPGGAGSFAYQIKDLIRAKSSELCASYGQANDCVDEVEVCITMVDEEEAEVRLCLNESSGDRDAQKPHRTSTRR
jgi:hypothetical protein